MSDLVLKSALALVLWDILKSSEACDIISISYCPKTHMKNSFWVSSSNLWLLMPQNVPWRLAGRIWQLFNFKRQNHKLCQNIIGNQLILYSKWKKKRNKILLNRNIINVVLSYSRDLLLFLHFCISITIMMTIDSRWMMCTVFILNEVIDGTSVQLFPPSFN